jgi:hypothetical protein
MTERVRSVMAACQGGTARQRGVSLTERSRSVRAAGQRGVAPMERLREVPP